MKLFAFYSAEKDISEKPGAPVAVKLNLLQFGFRIRAVFLFVFLITFHKSVVGTKKNRLWGRRFFKVPTTLVSIRKTENDHVFDFI